MDVSNSRDRRLGTPMREAYCVQLPWLQSASRLSRVLLQLQARISGEKKRTPTSEAHRKAKMVLRQAVHELATAQSG